MAGLRLRVLLTLFISLLFSLSTLAQVPAHPLIEDGILEAASASSTAVNSGGSMSVNGRTITVPDNLIVLFPASWVTWQDFVKGNFVGKEVFVAGNIVSR